MVKIETNRRPIAINADVPVFRLLSEEKIARLHDGAIKILEKTGIKVATESARKLLADADCPISRGTDIVKTHKPRPLPDEAQAQISKIISNIK